jgi:hypothetical protein
MLEGSKDFAFTLTENDGKLTLWLEFSVVIHRSWMTEPLVRAICDFVFFDFFDQRGSA